MGERNRRTERQEAKQTQINGWKWAFIGLVALLLSGVLYLVLSVQPVSINEPNTEAPATADDEMVLQAQMNKEDTEQLINTYLQAEVGEDFNNYEINLTEQLEVHGNITFAGLDIPFSLFMDPYVQENGNIQLRGDTVELAGVSLPVSAVMSLIGNQVDWPSFIAINSDDQVMMINLNELSELYDIGIAMTRLDLQEDVLELNLSVDSATLINNF